MPHKKSPKAVALHFILNNAKFDYLSKEYINTVESGDVLGALSAAFPDDPPTSEVFPEGLIAKAGDEVLVAGLVLSDSKGRGALQQAGTPKQKTEFDLITAQVRKEQKTDG